MIFSNKFKIYLNYFIVYLGEVGLPHRRACKLLGKIREIHLLAQICEEHHGELHRLKNENRLDFKTAAIKGLSNQ